jgi:hypothetical protein
VVVLGVFWVWWGVVVFCGVWGLFFVFQIIRVAIIGDEMI